MMCSTINGRYYLIVIILLTPIRPVHATEPEYLSGEQPVAPSVEQALGPIEEAFTPEVRRPSIFPQLRERMKVAPPFWRDTELILLPRLYSLNRIRDGATDIGAIALGGQFRYRSGWWHDRIKIGAAWFTSQKLHGSDDKDGTLLLQTGQQSFSVTGEAYLEAKISKDIRARLYRQTFDVPYVNRQDSRMLPNTFEAYTLINDRLKNIAFGISHVTKMKRRNDDKFIYISEAAGFPGTKEPLTMLGARYTLQEGITIGAINQYAWEFMNNFYAEGSAVWRFSDDLALKLAAQYTDQRSVGNELGGDFDTYVYGIKAAVSYRYATLTLTHTSTDDNSGIRSPFGGYPGYLSIIINDFNRAEEQGWLLGLSYDFTKVRLPGLSGFINFAKGNTPDSGTNVSPDQDELNVTVDYRFQEGPFEGLWLRARAAFIDQDNDVIGAVDLDDYRIIVNYEVPIL